MERKTRKAGGSLGKESMGQDGEGEGFIKSTEAKPRRRAKKKKQGHIQE